MKWFFALLMMGLMATSARAADSYDKLVGEFDAGWFCTGCVGCEETTDAETGQTSSCPCAIIANECGTPIQVACEVKEKAKAHFMKMRKLVKCRGEVDEKTAPRAPAQ